MLELELWKLMKITIVNTKIIRIENNVKYGDVIDGVDFEYVKNLTSVNAINLALLASSPPPPQNLKIGGIVEPSVKFKWDLNLENDIIGYKIYWR